MNRTELRDSRVSRLIDDFDTYVRAFSTGRTFTGRDQLALHRKTLALRDSAGDPWTAIFNPDFIRALHQTLVAWDMNSRGAKLATPEAFELALRSNAQSIADLDGLSIDQPDLPGDTGARLFAIVEGLDISLNKARIVAGTKVLHHLLPHLVVPVDREHTGRFFHWHPNEFQNHQRGLFLTTFRYLVRIGRYTHSESVLDAGWNSTRAKVIDNAIIGFCRQEQLPYPS